MCSDPDQQVFRGIGKQDREAGEDQGLDRPLEGRRLFVGRESVEDPRGREARQQDVQNAYDVFVELEFHAWARSVLGGGSLRSLQRSRQARVTLHPYSILSGSTKAASFWRAERVNCIA